MEALEKHTGPPIVHCEYNIICVYVIEDKRVTLLVKNIGIIVFFSRNNMAMVYLFLNMRNLLSCHHIYVPSHVHIKIPVIEIMNALIIL